MKKSSKIIIAVVLLLAIFAIGCLAGCHASETNTANISTATTITAEAAEKSFGFVLIKEDYLSTSYEKVCLYRESSTDVMYVFYENQVSYGGMGGLTVMIDPQTGGPLTYENWKNNYQK